MASASFDFGALVARLSGFVQRLRITLGRSAGRLENPKLRKLLVGILIPRSLPMETGDAFGGVPGQLRVSGAHAQISGEHRQLGASGEHSQPSSASLSGVKKRVKQRPGAGTFTPAQRSSGLQHSLTGGSKKLTPDEVEAIKHDSIRRKAETRARSVIDKHRAKFGKFKLEKLAALPRTFAPDALAAFQQAFPQVDGATVQLLTPLIAGCSRDVCDRAAVFLRWTESDRLQFHSAFPPESREKLRPALNALDALPAQARQALLRLPRVPVLAQLDALAAKWTGLDKEDVRNVALALAHFDGDELKRVINSAAAPVKIAPQGIRG